jgi:hypothetical protein
MSTETLPSIIVRSARAWNRFWFTPADPVVLGFIRICCGLVTLYVHLAYTWDLESLFGEHAWLNLRLADEYRHEAPWVAPSSGWDEQAAVLSIPADPTERERVLQYAQKWGVDPSLTTARGNNYWSIWFHVTDPGAMRLVHACGLVVMFTFTIGLFTRITSVLTWLMALSYIQRSPVSLFGMDTMMNIALIYLMIGASGRALSVDRLLARWRQPSLGAPAPMVSANFAIRLMQVHFCIIYMAAGLSKLLGGAWWNGTALWGTVANYEFTPLRFQLYADALQWLCRHRALWEVAMTGGAVFTLALEIAFPFLVWRPRLRGVMVAGSVVLHTGIAITMGLTGFGLFMLTLVFSFLPPELVHELIAKFGNWGPGPSGAAATVAPASSQAA